jgi:hypothetical protein
MFNPLTPSKTESLLNAEIEASLEALNDLRTSEDYAKRVDLIAKLHKLKTEERSKPISKDTVAVVAANIFGILWLTRYEKEHVISSKALGFVFKATPR